MNVLSGSIDSVAPAIGTATQHATVRAAPLAALELGFEELPQPVRSTPPVAIPITRSASRREMPSPFIAPS